MADDPLGNDDTTDDRRSDPSGTEPDAGTRDGPNGVESSDEWGAADRPTIDGDTDGDRDDDRDRIPLDLSDSSDDASASDDDEADDYAPEASSTPIEPGDPTLENALFVVLGVIAMVLVLVRLLTVTV
ncbi:DUF7312 domain-containing protein [Natrinema amylolyticum]|uniref:DUF7312 domain-containing protein n=1 Tax=Natrinema amylolyticum TaxID=2878679 RepID=UPI001CF9D084|nr:hypothetical protein [Natrinema amylolyticum]